MNDLTIDAQAQALSLRDTDTTANSPTSRSAIDPVDIVTPRIHLDPDEGHHKLQHRLAEHECRDLFNSLDHDLDGRVWRVALEMAMKAEIVELELDNSDEPIDTIIKHAWRFPAANSVDEAQFVAMAGLWDIPSQVKIQESVKGNGLTYIWRHLDHPLSRTLIAWWTVEGPISIFGLAIFGLQMALAVYYFNQNYYSKLYNELGIGLPIAKLATGFLYPALAFVLLSSSRKLAFLLRSRSLTAKLINWDKSQNYHSYLGWCILVFSVVHGVAHLTGSFRSAVTHSGSQLLAHRGFPQPITYSAMIGTRAGVTGILAFTIIIAICLTAHSKTRGSHFNIFQVTHFLIFAFVVLLLIHGSQSLLADSVLGYWLIVPMLVVLWDRCDQLYRTIRPVPNVTARLTSSFTAVLSIPNASLWWKYQPGQYITVRCPQLSRWQWHPFSVVAEYSADRDTVIGVEVYIRAAGDWTKALQEALKSGKQLDFNMAGPFGSPATGMSQYQHLVVIGANIGITPYVSWINDVHQNQTLDLHWIVRDRITFAWFTALLNGSIYKKNVKVQTYITAQAPRSILSHASRCLIERYRTINCPRSLITGLDSTTIFGRPDIELIFTTAIDRIPKNFSGKIGVFYCGPTQLGMEISDRCRVERLKNNGIKWQFVDEVF